MQALRAFRSGKAPFAVAAAGLLASSTLLERRTIAEPARATPVASPHSTDGGGGEAVRDTSSTGDDHREESPSPAAIGPMIAVFLDESSVDRLKAHFPEAREGQLRKVVLQYGPSATERQIYQHLFSGRAEVTVTGEAASFGRRALVASVSHAGDVVEPMSLSSAIDISPPAADEEPSLSPEDGPGPLASAVLIEQIKRVGATAKETWRGTLPPLLAHNRQFPSEDGTYARLEHPITVKGTICRADWVDGASTRCRDTIEGGKKREEDWTPSLCSICAVFEASPCRDIFTNRFVPISKRYDEYTKAAQQDQEEKNDITESKAETQPRGSDDRPQEGSRVTDADGGSRGAHEVEEARTVMTAEGSKGGAEEGTEREVNNNEAHRRSSEEEERQNERDLIGDQLQADVLAAIKDLRECMIYHDI